MLNLGVLSWIHRVTLQLLDYTTNKGRPVWQAQTGRWQGQNETKWQTDGVIERGGERHGGNMNMAIYCHTRPQGLWVTTWGEIMDYSRKADSVWWTVNVFIFIKSEDSEIGNYKTSEQELLCAVSVCHVLRWIFCVTHCVRVQCVYFLQSCNLGEAGWQRYKWCDVH